MKCTKWQIISLCSGLMLVSSVQAADQWADKLLAFSSQYSSTDWSARKVLGIPTIFVYGDDRRAWAPSTSSGTKEFVTVGFTNPVYADGVTIRETYGAGFVTSIEAIDVKNVVHTVWTGTDTSVPGQVNDFKVTWPRTTYLVKAITVRTDTDLSAGWDEIDAIQLHGLDSLSGTLSERLGHSAQLICTNVTTGQTITRTIIGTGTSDPVTKWDCDRFGLKAKAGEQVSVQISGTLAN